MWGSWRMGTRLRITKAAASTALLLVVLIAGCTSSPGGQAVSGNVKLDGGPLAKGTILFTPLPGTPGDVAGGEIVDGKYSIAAAAGPHAGKHRVEIRALRKSGKKVQ